MMKKAAAETKTKGKKLDLHTASVVNSGQGKDAVILFGLYYSIHQLALALGMIKNFLTIGTIFNLAKVNTVPCMLVATLSWIENICLNSLVKTESITDAYRQWLC